MEKETMIRPSLLASSFAEVGNDIHEMVHNGVKTLHFDVMDGTFVDDISFGESLFKPLFTRFSSEIGFDVHLMVVNPMKHVREFAKLGAREISFHYEAMSVGDLARINEVRSDYPDLKLGLAFSPETTVDEILTLLPLFDFVLVMSVVPGKGGQTFIMDSLKKISALDQYRKEKGLSFYIGVDGGINDETAKMCMDAGLDYMVAGSYYFRNKDKKTFLSSFMK